MPNLLVDDKFNTGVLFTMDNNVNYDVYNIQRIPSPANTFLEIGTYNDYYYYRLRDYESENTVALLQTTITESHGVKYQELKNIEVIDEMQGKGCGLFLYRASFNFFDLPAITDDYLTFASVNHWKKLRFKWKQNKYNIGYINLITGKRYDWTRGTKDYILWGMPDSFFSDLNEMIYEDNDERMIIEDMYTHESISKEHYNFLIENFDELRNRSHIRLFVDKKK